MKVLLIQADGSYPNLALMKISALHKSLGDTVFLKHGLTPDLLLECPNPDKVYISCIFEWNKDKAIELSWKFDHIPVQIGGCGVNKEKLPYHIESLRPDYSLYGIDYSMGYTSRGCNRKCAWCIVWRNEGCLSAVASIEDFHEPGHNKVILFDNNFLDSPAWFKELCYINDWKLKVNFFQGLDIRLVDHNVAVTLAHTAYYDSKFGNRTLHFAFDSMDVEPAVLQGIQVLEKTGVPRRHLMFYVLVGFNTSYEKDMHRINVLLKEKVKPYIMPYNNRHDSYYPHLERWINGRFYKVVPWEKYDHGASQQIIQGLTKE